MTVASRRPPEALAPQARAIGPTVVAKSLRDALEADTIILAVPFGEHREVTKALPSWKGKTVIDAMNALVPPEELDGLLSSAFVAKSFTGAKFVKGFNHLVAATLAADPIVKGGESAFRVAAVTVLHKDVFAIREYRWYAACCAWVPLNSNGTLILGNSPDGNGCANRRGVSHSSDDSEQVQTVRIDYNINANNTAWFRFQSDTGRQAAYTDPINPLFNAVSSQPLYSFASGYAARHGAVAQSRCFHLCG